MGGPYRPKYTIRISMLYVSIWFEVNISWQTKFLGFVVRTRVQSCSTFVIRIRIIIRKLMSRKGDLERISKLCQKCILGHQWPQNWTFPLSIENRVCHRCLIGIMCVEFNLWTNFKSVFTNTRIVFEYLNIRRNEYVKVFESLSKFVRTNHGS